MRAILQWVSWTVGLSLQALLLTVLVRGAYRVYPFVFAYVLALFLTTVVEVSVYVNTGGHSSTWTKYYWLNDGIRTLLIVCVVMSMIDKALASRRVRDAARHLLTIAILSAAGISVLLHQQADAKNMWWSNVSRDLNFVSAILNLILWALLIGSKEKDYRLLLISGGLGIQYTGAALGQSLRTMSPTTTMAGNIVVLVSHFLCLYVWWEAFRKNQNHAAITRAATKQTGA